MAHEELKEQYEKDLKKYGDDAFCMWEFKRPEERFFSPLNNTPAWSPFCEYRRKEPPFEPQYYSGLNWRDAEKLIGKKLLFSDSGDRWTEPMTLKEISGHDNIKKFAAGYGWWVYMQTCPETHAHPTVTYNINGKEWVLPRPETEAPEMNSTFWFLNIHKEVVKGIWENSFYMKILLEDENVHRTESRAQAWADFYREAILGEIKK